MRGKARFLRVDTYSIRVGQYLALITLGRVTKDLIYYRQIQVLVAGVFIN